MTLFRLLLSTAFMALSLPFYLAWGRNQSEAQIERMQKDAFNTPGAQAPIPTEVLLGGMALVLLHWLWGRLLSLRWWQSVMTFFGGIVAGIALFVWQRDTLP